MSSYKLQAFFVLKTLFPWIPDKKYLLLCFQRKTWKICKKLYALLKYLNLSSLIFYFLYKPKMPCNIIRKAYQSKPNSFWDTPKWIRRSWKLNFRLWQNTKFSFKALKNIMRLYAWQRFRPENSCPKPYSPFPENMKIFHFHGSQAAHPIKYFSPSHKKFSLLTIVLQKC